MDVETAIRAFASAGHDLPREAMRWALDNWDEAAPGLLGVLERFADGTDRSEEAANAAFFILHLAGERRERRAFAPLCRLAKDAEAIEAVLGDGVTTTLKGILISTYDGDLDALKGVIEAEGGGRVCPRRRPGGPGLPGGDRPGRARGGGSLPAPALRCAAAAARELRLVRLDLGGSAPRARGDVRDRPAGVHARPDRPDGHGLRPLPRGSRADARRSRADGGLRHDNITPLEDATGELAGWYAFSDAAKQDRARRIAREVAGIEPRAPQLPAVNPLKGVGRNDPCPCGSGKKFKKCCLPRASSGAGLP